MFDDSDKWLNRLSRSTAIFPSNSLLRRKSGRRSTRSLFKSLSTTVRRFLMLIRS